VLTIQVVNIQWNCPKLHKTDTVWLDLCVLLKEGLKILLAHPTALAHCA